MEEIKMAKQGRPIILTHQETREELEFKTLQAAGEHLGITRERIRQLAEKRGGSHLHRKSGYEITYGAFVNNLPPVVLTNKETGEKTGYKSMRSASLAMGRGDGYICQAIKAGRIENNHYAWQLNK